MRHTANKFLVPFRLQVPIRILSNGLIKDISKATLPVKKQLIMSKFTKKKAFIGVDISKDTLDFSILLDSDPQSFEDKQVPNSFSGFSKIEKWLSSKPFALNECLFCMEHTGTYGLLLFAWLSQLEVDYVVEPALRIKRSMGMARGKNDRVDARRIADYAYTNRTKLKPFVMPSSLLLQIKQLLTYRDQLTRMSTSLKNSLKNHREYEQVIGSTSITESITGQIDDIQTKKEDIDRQIKELIQSDKELNKNYNLVKSVKGIGLMIAAYMLVTTHNFTSFENGRKYACYSGIAPFEHTSGSSIRGQTRVSHLANKRIKTLLSNGANSACKWDPDLRAYYKRKTGEGKDHNLVINSISCKLVNRVFAVIKRQTPYVTMYAQNF